jgi:hypothetical protein
VSTRIQNVQKGKTADGRGDGPTDKIVRKIPNESNQVRNEMAEDLREREAARE